MDIEQAGAQKLSRFNIAGHQFHVRTGTSDYDILREVMFSRNPPYEFPNIKAEVIFDIGANVGAVTVLLANKYPEAKIFAFEPEPENYKILQNNTKEYSNVSCHNIALGWGKSVVKLFRSDNPWNMGGFSIFETGSKKDEFVPVDMETISVFMLDHGIQKVDIIKIDTEGSEHDILFEMDYIDKTSWIVGELHGNTDDYKLLGWLSQYFVITLDANKNARLQNFQAIRRGLAV